MIELNNTAIYFLLVILALKIPRILLLMSHLRFSFRCPSPCQTLPVLHPLRSQSLPLLRSHPLFHFLPNHRIRKMKFWRQLIFRPRHPMILVNSRHPRPHQRSPLFHFVEALLHDHFLCLNFLHDPIAPTQHPLPPPLVSPFPFVVPPVPTRVAAVQLRYTSCSRTYHSGYSCNSWREQ